MKTLVILIALIGGIILTGCTKNQLTGTMHSNFKCIFDNIECSGGGSDAGGDGGDAGGP